MADDSKMSSEPMAAEGGKRSQWMSHVKSVMRANKGKSLKQVLKMAAKSYKKTAKMTMGKKTSKKSSRKGFLGLYGGKKGSKTRRNSRK
jgi:hypothetical protein